MLRRQEGKNHSRSVKYALEEHFLRLSYIDRLRLGQNFKLHFSGTNFFLCMD